MSELQVYDFEYFPTLTTERLILRELRLEHLLPLEYPKEVAEKINNFMNTIDPKGLKDL